MRVPKPRLAVIVLIVFLHMIAARFAWAQYDDSQVIDESASAEIYRPLVMEPQIIEAYDDDPQGDMSATPNPYYDYGTENEVDESEMPGMGPVDPQPNDTGGADELGLKSQ
jgi:hypothetical protein